MYQYEAIVKIEDFQRKGVNLDLDFQLYSIAEQRWLALEEWAEQSARDFNLSRRLGVHKLNVAFEQQEDFSRVMNPPLFRLIWRGSDGLAENVLITQPKITQEENFLHCDHGVVLFLGEHGFEILSDEGKALICAGFPRPNDEDYNSLISGFFQNPDAIRDCEAEKGKLQATIDRISNENKALKADIGRVAEENQKLQQDIKDCEARARKLQEEKNELANQIESLESQLETLTNDLQQKTQALEKAQQLIESLEGQIQELKQQNAKLRQENQTLGERLDKLNELLAEETRKREDAERDLEACVGKSVELQQKISTLEQEKETLESQLAACQKAVADLQEQLKECDPNEANNKIQELRGLLAVERAEKQAIEKQLRDLQKQTQNPVQMQSVFKSIGSSLTKAAEEMKSSSTNYRISGAKANVKMILAGDGTHAFLPDVSVSADTNVVSEIEVEFSTDVSEPSTERTVPSLIGLTESSVREKLAQYGLRLEIGYQLVEDQSLSGRAVNQIPKAGEPVRVGATVRAVFGQLGVE